MQVRLSAAAVIVMASCLVPGARADSPKPDDIVKPIFVQLDSVRVSRIGQNGQSRRLGAGGDTVFHLRRVNLSECSSLMPEDDELASAESK
jgi:hypothetical protein